jgi:hypothetical protein
MKPSSPASLTKSCLNVKENLRLDSKCRSKNADPKNSASSNINFDIKNQQDYEPRMHKHLTPITVSRSGIQAVCNPDFQSIHLFDAPFNMKENKKAQTLLCSARRPLYEPAVSDAQKFNLKSAGVLFLSRHCFPVVANRLRLLPFDPIVYSLLMLPVLEMNLKVLCRVVSSGRVLLARTVVALDSRDPPIPSVLVRHTSQLIVS